MKRVVGFPGKFVIGEGVLGDLARYVKLFGNKACLVAFKDDSERVIDYIKIAKENDIELTVVDFGGECTYAEIERISKLCKETSSNCVIGLGGGKAIDTAKVVSLNENLPLIVVPTIASTDAPCSGLSIVYDENHKVAGVAYLPLNPAVILVDSGVICKAPKRFLVAGFGDAYATYYEARAAVASCANNYVGGKYTNAAWHLAKLCNDILLDDSLKALAACDAKVVTPALDNVIEANLLLSGLGFESVGCAGAHSLHNAFTALHETRKSLHGEIVAIGLLIQLVLENSPAEEITEVLGYFRSVGLPTKLADIGITDLSREHLDVVLKGAIGTPTNAIHNMPFEVTEQSLYNAILYVDKLSEIY